MSVSASGQDPREKSRTPKNKGQQRCSLCPYHVQPTKSWFSCSCYSWCLNRCRHGWCFKEYTGWEKYSKVLFIRNLCYLRLSLVNFWTKILSNVFYLRQIFGIYLLNHNDRNIFNFSIKFKGIKFKRKWKRYSPYQTLKFDNNKIIIINNESTRYVFNKKPYSKLEINKK